MPIQVSSKMQQMNLQNANFLIGENFLFSEWDFSDSNRNPSRAISINITPPSFLGTDRKMA
jgi:hypothetical protein